MTLFEYKKKVLDTREERSTSPSENQEVIIFNVNDEYSIYPVLEGLNKTGYRVGLNKIQTKEVEIAIRELVSNVIRHGGGSGQVRFIIDKTAPAELAIEVEDWGKGIGNIGEAIEDGYSTGGGLGGGLPAVNRMMDSFKLVSRPNDGTLFRTVKRAIKPIDFGTASWKYSVYSRPVTTETDNGDGFFIRRRGKTTFIFIIDGLGHGFEAHLATEKAVKNLENIYHWQEEEIIEVLHKKLKHTRGIVIGIAIAHDDHDYIRYTGIGNIAGYIFGKKNSTFLNYNGTIGGRLLKFKTFDYPYKTGDVLILHSDGLSSSWTKKYSELWRGNLQDFTSKIFTNYRRAADDSTIIAGIRR